jgi:hypothetical protein
MNHEGYKRICLAIKNDVEFEEFCALCTPRNYSDDHVDRIWKMYCDKPLEFVLYHDVGRDIFEYLRVKEEIIRQFYLP